MSLSVTLRQLDYDALDISDYSRRYILRLLPSLDYYLDIYRHALDRLTAAHPAKGGSTAAPDLAALTLVDYGGGHGFFSMAAKARGIGRVIYVDNNPLAVSAAQTVAAAAGTGADLFLCGDAATLDRWCRDNDTRPDLLAGMDVIEHIYRLEPFFDTLHALNPRLHMLFTTGSNPGNPWIRRRLHRIMRMDECGTATQKGFLQLRRDHIAARRPDLGDDTLDSLAAATRGLSFVDIDTLIPPPPAAIPSVLPAPPAGPDTCDPASGSWTERLLPLDDYKRMNPGLSTSNGFYNTHRPGLKGLASQLLNPLLGLPCTRWFAPFIFLEFKPSPHPKDCTA